jgi:hypothetical protein
MRRPHVPRRLRTAHFWFGIVALATAAAVSAQTAGARPAKAPSLTVSARTVAFGATLVLKGVVPGAQAGSEVQILAQACGFTGPVPVGTTKTTTGGSYSFALQPMLNTLYLAQVGDAHSNGARVRVTPAVQLRHIRGAKYAVDVSVGAGQFFTSKVALQAHVKRHWRTIGTASLKQNSDPGAVTAVSSAIVHAAAKPGTELRASVSQSAVGRCYTGAKSAPVTP